MPQMNEYVASLRETINHGKTATGYFTATKMEFKDRGIEEFMQFHFHIRYCYFTPMIGRNVEKSGSIELMSACGPACDLLPGRARELEGNSPSFHKRGKPLEPAMERVYSSLPKSADIAPPIPRYPGSQSRTKTNRIM